MTHIQIHRMNVVAVTILLNFKPIAVCIRRSHDAPIAWASTQIKRFALRSFLIKAKPTS
jgi:hypothetical protein